MSASNRAAKLAKLSKVVKKHYQRVKPPSDRSVLEHLLYAACLEDAGFEQADEAFARLQETYFDWNEVRVTTVAELTESMNCLPEPDEAAQRLKSSLHAVFESQYSFDLEFLRKENQGKAIQRLESFKGVSSFITSYVIQNALSGHSIAIGKAEIELARVLGMVTDKEARRFSIPGLERAIPKNKGSEFMSLLHQLAVAYYQSMHSPNIRKIILEVDAEAKDRFPKRSSGKSAGGESATQSKSAKTKTSPKSAKAPEAEKPTADKGTAAKSRTTSAATKSAATKPAATKSATPKSAQKASAATAKPAKTVEPKSAATKAAGTKASAVKSSEAKSTASKGVKKKAVTKKAEPKKPTPTSKAAKKTPAKKAPAKKAKASVKKSATKSLARKKPR